MAGAAPLGSRLLLLSFGLRCCAVIIVIIISIAFTISGANLLFTCVCNGLDLDPDLDLSGLCRGKAPPPP